MTASSNDIQADIEAIQSITIVPSLLDVICRTTGMGFAAIARVTEEKWVTCGVKDDIAFGLKPGSELPLGTTICHEIRQNGEAVIIDHVLKNDHFRNHHTPAMYGFQSYISVPIFRKDGSFFGTLCAIDPKPRKLETPEIRGMFYLFADLISLHLDNLEKIQVAEARLLEEKKIAGLREEFIAILGHDLRNPVSAISSSLQLMNRKKLDPSLQKLTGIMQNSTHRISGLIDNMLDFARGRMGEGIVLSMSLGGLEKTLQNVLSEMQAIWPERELETNIQISSPIRCDNNRIGQLFSNLLSNALIYGDKNQRIRVKAGIDEANFILSVANHGTEITRQTLQKLFLPYARGNSKDGNQGLGLGLYIASEIARAHGGTLSVSSTWEETVFTLKIPCGQN